MGIFILFTSKEKKNLFNSSVRVADPDPVGSGQYLKKLQTLNFISILVDKFIYK